MYQQLETHKNGLENKMLTVDAKIGRNEAK